MVIPTQTQIEQRMNDMLNLSKMVAGCEARALVKVTYHGPTNTLGSRFTVTVQTLSGDKVKSRRMPYDYGSGDPVFVAAVGSGLIPDGAPIAFSHTDGRNSTFYSMWLTAIQFADIIA